MNVGHDDDGAPQRHALRRAPVRRPGAVVVRDGRIAAVVTGRDLDGIDRDWPWSRRRPRSTCRAAWSRPASSTPTCTPCRVASSGSAATSPRAARARTTSPRVAAYAAGTRSCPGSSAAAGRWRRSRAAPPPRPTSTRGPGPPGLPAQPRPPRRLGQQPRPRDRRHRRAHPRPVRRPDRAGRRRPPVGVPLHPAVGRVGGVLVEAGEGEGAAVDPGAVVVAVGQEDRPVRDHRVEVGRRGGPARERRHRPAAAEDPGQVRVPAAWSATSAR